MKPLASQRIRDAGALFLLGRYVHPKVIVELYRALCIAGNTYTSPNTIYDRRATAEPFDFKGFSGFSFAFESWLIVSGFDSYPQGFFTPFWHVHLLTIGV